MLPPEGTNGWFVFPNWSNDWTSKTIGVSESNVVAEVVIFKAEVLVVWNSNSGFWFWLALASLEYTFTKPSRTAPELIGLAITIQCLSSSTCIPCIAIWKFKSESVLV